MLPGEVGYLLLNLVFKALKNKEKILLPIYFSN